MGLTRADLTDPKNSAQDKKEIAVALGNYMANDEWVKKALGSTAILITSHPGNRAYLKAYKLPPQLHFDSFTNNVLTAKIFVSYFFCNHESERLYGYFSKG